jgi:hypothetical protein
MMFTESSEDVEMVEIVGMVEEEWSFPWGFIGLVRKRRR